MPNQKTPRDSISLAEPASCRIMLYPEADLIRHIVFFSAKRREYLETIREDLRALGTIPHSTLFEVSLNSKVDPLSDEIDVVVYAEFADEAALAAYKAHPTYAETTARVRPMRELRFSADVKAG
jgi:quinol monooxygenase YgiN